MLFLRMIEGNFEVWQWVILLIVMVPMAVLDIKTKHVNTYICLAAIIAATAIRVSAFNDEDITILIDMIPGAVMLLIAFLTKEKIGYGDGLILVFIGVVTGYSTTIISLFISLILSASLSGILLLLKKADRETEIPFIPFMSLGIFAGGIL